MKKYSSAIIILFFALLISSCGNNKNANLITASGTIESVDVTVSSKLSGQIKQINIKEGDKVKKGDLLVEIDHDLLDIQLRQAEARVEQADAQLKLLLSGARKEDIETAEQSLKQAKINLDLAKEDKERFTSLYDTRTITKKQYDDAVARYDLSLAQYNTAKENLNKIRTIIRPEEIESAKANIKSLIASADLLRKNIEDSLGLQQLMDRAVKDVPEATEEEIAKFYEANSSKFATPEQLRASHILLKVDSKNTPEEKAEVKKKIEAIRAEIESNAITFADAAAKYSQDSGNAAKGGDLGFFARGRMVKPFEEAAFAAKPGTVTPVVETQFGYHIIKVAELKPAGQLSLEQAKAPIKQVLNQSAKQRAAQKYMDELKAKAAVESFMTAEEFVKRHPSK